MGIVLVQFGGPDHLPVRTNDRLPLGEGLEGLEQAIELGGKDLGDEGVEGLEAILEGSILDIGGDPTVRGDEGERLLLVGEHEAVAPDGPLTAQAQGGVVDIAHRLAFKLVEALQQAPVLLGRQLGIEGVVDAGIGKKGCQVGDERRALLLLLL